MFTIRLSTVVIAWLVVFTILAIPALATEEACLQAADHCWTVSDYDEAYEDPFSEFDIMDYFGVPESSAAHSFPSEPQKPASKRQLGVGLVETPFTFFELILRLGWSG